MLDHLINDEQGNNRRVLQNHTKYINKVRGKRRVFNSRPNVPNITISFFKWLILQQCKMGLQVLERT